MRGTWWCCGRHGSRQQTASAFPGRWSSRPPATRLHATPGRTHPPSTKPPAASPRPPAAAIIAGARLSAIAGAEHDGEPRAHKRSAQTCCGTQPAPPSAKREADSEYEHAITRAGRLGLSHREIAAAAHVSHGTIHAILARATPGANNGRADEPQPVDGEPGELAA